jgi:hypothetical protein
MTNMTGSKLSIFSHPGKITGYWITTRSLDNSEISVHEISFHRVQRLHSVNMGRGMITRPIWK